MFRHTIEFLAATIVSVLLIATPAMAMPVVPDASRVNDTADGSPWLEPGQLVNISEDRAFSYGSRREGFGVLDISVEMAGDEFEVEIVDTPPVGEGCSLYTTHVAGEVYQEISPDCDMESLLVHLQAIYPDAVLTGQLGDWWSDAASNHSSGEGEDYSPPGPHTEREDGTAGECTAAQGHCLMYVAAAAATGIGTAVVATPFAGALVGSIALTGAVLVCAGTIQDACNEDIQDVLDSLFQGWPLDLVNPWDYLSYLDFLEYIESLVDVSSIGHVITATATDSLSPADGYECSALLVGLEESLQIHVDAWVSDQLLCIEASLAQP